MSLSSRTVGLSILGAAIVGALAYVSFRDDPVAVDLHTITRGPLEVTVDADGKTRIRDLFEVAAPISGTALRSPVEVGDDVTGGETIVAIVEPIAPSLLDARTRLQGEASLQEARAALNVAETDLRKSQEDEVFAQSQFDRVQTLVERNVSSITRLEDASQKLAIAKAGVEAARARIEMAKGTLERVEAGLLAPGAVAASEDSCCVELRAPVDGKVLSIDTISERPVISGTQLLTIGDPTNLELVADLLSGDAVRLVPGAFARVERWGGMGTLDAELDRIEPVARTKVSALGIEEQRVDAIFNLTSPLEDRASLGDGFSVFLRVREWYSDDVLRVPLSALFRANEDWAVFVVNDGLATLRVIQLGHRNTRFAEVLTGLEAGEVVITHPSSDAADGVSVIDRSEI